MLRRNPEMHQRKLFGTDLLLQLDPNEPLLNHAVSGITENY